MRENDEAYDFDNDPEWVEFYLAELKKEQEQPQPTYTPGDRWSDPDCADPDTLLINWL